ncbi:hypothetical protein NQ176_g10382 [Zarea fungicola]|uniref:Uncharacterized protein n=1 Tax=Zarea fungicola TaxID=93591 RepID=A0ACC1MGT1_9HYPO|nr:hypothetical protein NQ176_g10382 [Lecanicillium fungicola]
MAGSNQPSELLASRSRPELEKHHDEEIGKPVSSHGHSTSESTRRGLKSRHAQMIALGGSIGTGLFVGSGQGLKLGGPAFLLACYTIITVLLYGVATGIGEISAYLPVPGSGVAYYGHRFVSRSLGFTLVPTAAWYTIIAVVIIACNFFPVSVYGETEFWFASTKVIAIIGLLILTIILFFGAIWSKAASAVSAPLSVP